MVAFLKLQLVLDIIFKMRYFRYFFFLVAIIHFSCEKNPDIPVGQGNFSFQINISNVNITNANLKLTTLNKTKVPIQEKGVCWALTSNPTVNSNYLVISNEQSTYQLRDLIPNSTYFVRAYVKLNGGYIYGETSQIKTNIQPANLTSGLVAYYPFNLNILDYSGVGNHLNGTNTYTTNRHGIPNSAIALNGTSNYLSKINPLNFSSGNAAYTLSFWFKADTWKANMALGGYGPSNINFTCNYVKTLPNLGIAHYHWNLDYNFNFNFGAGTWNHFVITYDGTREYYYVNSQLRATFSHPNNTKFLINPIIFSVGARIASPPSSNVTEYFSGAFDEIRIYNRALSSSDVSALYNL